MILFDKNIKSSLFLILLAGCSGLGQTKDKKPDDVESLSKYIKDFDNNHDGKLSMLEFGASIPKENGRAIVSDDLINQTFKSYDINGDGFIDESELSRIKKNAESCEKMGGIPLEKCPS